MFQKKRWYVITEHLPPNISSFVAEMLIDNLTKAFFISSGVLTPFFFPKRDGWSSRAVEMVSFKG